MLKPSDLIARWRGKGSRGQAQINHQSPRLFSNDFAWVSVKRVYMRRFAYQIVVLIVLARGNGSFSQGMNIDAPFHLAEAENTSAVSKQPIPATGSEPIEVPETPAGLFEMEEDFSNLPRVLDSEGHPLEDVTETDRFEYSDREDTSRQRKSWTRSGGYLEYRGTYSTNIDLSAPEIDFDLRRNYLNNLDAIRETEVNDWINGLVLDYQHEISLIPDTMKAALRYRLEHDNFADENREERTHQTLELATIQKLTDTIEWEIYGGYEFENRSSQAQYLTPDYGMWYIGSEARASIGEKGRLEMGYEYSDRDYDFYLGGLPASETPWEDWEEHRTWLGYDYDLCEQVTLNLDLNFMKRDHESTALDAVGARIDGTYRQHDIWEPRVGFTFKPTERDYLRVYYKNRSLTSTGDYYDYDQNSVVVQYARKINPNICQGLVFRTEFEYARREYDHQAALDDNPGAGLRRRKDKAREDDRISLYFALEKEVGKDWLTGVEYTYLDNDSSDDSSRYREDRYGIYVRREF